MLQILLVVILLAVFMVVVTMLSRRGDDKKACITLNLVALIYAIGYLYFTLFSRQAGTASTFEWLPFRTYARLFEAQSTNTEPAGSLASIFLFGTLPIHGLILNVFLFYPLGYLLPILFPRLKPKHVILIGCLCSIATEATQYLLKMGWCETDDVIHNTLGTAIGVWVWLLQSKRLNKPQTNELPKD